MAWGFVMLLGQIMDILTTILGLQCGFVEWNPVAIKIGMQNIYIIKALYGLFMIGWFRWAYERYKEWQVNLMGVFIMVVTWIPVFTNIIQVILMGE